jgi:hypothetical protein
MPRYLRNDCDRQFCFVSATFKSYVEIGVVRDQREIFNEVDEFGESATIPRASVP